MEKIPMNPTGARRHIYLPSNEDTLESHTEYMLGTYFNGGYDSPEDFNETLQWTREHLFPRYDIPDPGVKWEEDLLRHIGYRRIPGGLEQIFDTEGSLQSKNEILDT